MMALGQPPESVSHMKQNPHTLEATAADETPILHIPTSNGPSFTIDAEDLHLIGNGPFYWNSDGHGNSYVRCHGLDNNLILARIIAGAGARQNVHYRDRNRANLRKANLQMGSGGAKWCDAVFVRLPPVEGPTAGQEASHDA